MTETAASRALVMFRENRFLTLGTVSDQEPWVAPINYVIGPGRYLHFYSAVESRHAADIARNDHVACSVFNSTAASEEVDGMQFSARCKIVPDAELEHVLEYYFRVNFSDSEERAWWYRPAGSFREPEPWRLFRLEPTAVYVIDMKSFAETRIDRREEADLDEVLHGLEELNA